MLNQVLRITQHEKMENFLNNYGLQHIVENILMYSDIETLLKCRIVNQTWRKFIDNPRFWIKRGSKTMDTKWILKDFQTNQNNLLFDIKIQNKERIMALHLIDFHIKSEKTKNSKQIRAIIQYIMIKKIWKDFKRDNFQGLEFQHFQANPNYFVTPFHQAADEGHLEVVKTLLNFPQKFVDLTINPISGWTPIHYAARSGHLEIVKFLTSITSKPNVQTNTFQRNTPIHLAAALGHKEIVKCLITSDHNLNIANSCGKTALDLATQNGHIEVIELLLEKCEN